MLSARKVRDPYSRSDCAHQYRPLSIDELRDPLVHRHDDLANLPDREGVTGPSVLAAILQITGGNLHLVVRLLAQIERVHDINGLDTVTVEIVDAAREVLVIGGRPPFSLIFGYIVCTAATSSGHGMIWFMSARNCARRVVFPYFSKPVSACGGRRGSPGGYSVAPQLDAERDRSGSEI